MFCRPGRLLPLAAAATGNFSSQDSTACLDRRDVLKVAAAALLLPHRTAWGAELPPEPPVGDCIECIGEVNGNLNACEYATTSCVSTQNDDEAHFTPPWQYDGSQGAAVNKVISVATGTLLGVTPAKSTQVSPLQTPQIVIQGVLSTLKGQPLQRQQSQQKQREPVKFSGQLRDRHSKEGYEYVRIALAPTTSSGVQIEPGNVIDAEFLFPNDDAIVVIRASSRKPPGLAGGNVSLSLSQGLVYDQNVARRLLEQLRTALRFEQAPVITDFDPRFNQDKNFWFEKLYQPFLFDKEKGTEAVE